MHGATVKKKIQEDIHLRYYHLSQTQLRVEQNLSRKEPLQCARGKRGKM